MFRADAFKATRGSNMALGIQMHLFEQTSRPVIFEHEDAQFPYWGKGSSILLADSRHYFWITASHVVSRMGGSAQSLRIFPSDDSRISLPFNEQYTINKDLSEDEDHKDIFALRINVEEFAEFGDAPLAAQDIERGLLPAEELTLESELWIIGYPAESNVIDYDCGRIRNTRSVIRAIYQGRSLSDHCHVARIESSIQLTSYDGLSGSPVFYMHSKIAEGRELLFPLFVGMLLRGTASSSLVHFVSASVIRRLIQLAGKDA
jgi:hypothetical protein